MEWEQPHWSGRPTHEAAARRKLKPNGFARLARIAAGHAWLVIAFHMLVATACAVLAAILLTVDPDAEVRVTLDERTAAAQQELDRHFPNIEQTFLAVVEAGDGLAARDRALGIAAALLAEDELFSSAYVPGTGAFYDRFGLLFLDPEELRIRVDDVLQRQPLFHALATAPDLRGLAVLVAEIARVVSQGRSPPGLEAVLLAAADATEAEVAGTPRPVDWTRLAGLRPNLDSPRWFVLAVPRPGKERAAAILAQRASGSGLGVLWLWPRRALSMPPSLLRDFLVPGGLSVFLAALLLAAGLGSFRLTGAVLLACWTSVAVAAATAALLGRALDQATWAFAAAAAAPTLVGGTAMAIGYRQGRTEGITVQQAMMLAGHRYGGLVTAIICVFASFWLAWLLRQLPSLSHFAVISLAGAVAALPTTLLLVPALTVVIDARQRRSEPHWLDEAFAGPESLHGRNVGQMAALAVLAAAVFCTVFLPGIRFGERNIPAGPDLLLDTPDARGAVHILVRPEEAEGVIAGLAALPEVGAVRAITQFVPPDPLARIAELQRLEGVFDDLPVPRHVPPDGRSTESLRNLETELALIAASTGASRPLRIAAERMRRAVQQFATPWPPTPDRIERLELALFGGLAELPAAAAALSRLRPPGVADLESGLRARFVSADGQWRIEVLPRSGTGLLSFAAALRRAYPQSAGEPIVALTRNEIVHHETLLALATALAAAGVIVLAGLRTIGGVLATLLPAACFITLTAAVTAGLGMVLTSALLAAASAAMALLLGCAMVMAHTLAMTGPATMHVQGAAVRAGLLPLIVMAGAVAPLALSGRPAVRDTGSFMATILLLSALLCLLLVPATVRGMSQFDRS